MGDFVKCFGEVGVDYMMMTDERVDAKKVKLS